MVLLLYLIGNMFANTLIVRLEQQHNHEF